MDDHRLGQIAQPVLTEQIGGHSEGHCGERGEGFVGHQHLTAVTGRHDARCAVHRGPEVVAVALEGPSDVHTHPHAWGEPAGPLLRGQTPLRVEHAVHRVLDGVECRTEGIACHREHAATVLLDGGAHGVVVSSDDVVHRLGFALPRQHAALHVGEHERDVSTRAASGEVADGRVPAGSAFVIGHGPGRLERTPTPNPSSDGSSDGVG